MAEPIQPSLQTALSDLVRWLDAARIPSMIIGGVAASALGRPRLTQDIDALAIVPDEGWAKVIDSASQYGIVPRIEGALDFARRSRVLLLRHSDSGIDVDVTFGGLPFEEAAVARSQDHDVGGLRVRLPRVEDLLVMKAIPGAVWTAQTQTVPRSRCPRHLSPRNLRISFSSQALHMPPTSSCSPSAN